MGYIKAFGMYPMATKEQLGNFRQVTKYDLDRAR